MKKRLLILTGLFLTAGAALGIRAVFAQQPTAQTIAKTLHPTFAILDSNGANATTTGNPASTMQTCGQCHDTAYIQSHAFHSDLGLSDYASSKNVNSSNGLFGEWNPLTYRFLSQGDDERLDLSTAEWLMTNGSRVVGGGPAEISREGKPLTSLQPNAKNVETNVLDSKTGVATAWDWNKSGVMEMNCFLCHLENPDNEARVKAIQAGQFGLADTATLFGTGIAIQTSAGFEWNSSAFNEDGELKEEYVGLIQDPTNANCAACHGEVHPESNTPLTVSACNLDYPQTATTGQVVAAQKIKDSGVNLKDKDALNRSWDIHTERELKCADCHYAINNPARKLESQSEKPAHLVYDPRVLDINEYLLKPNHNLARGQSAQFNVAPESKGSMRRCDSCHDANVGHSNWLPYPEKHMAEVACESCHIPKMYAPAIQTYDWTVLTENGAAVQTCRGIEGSPDNVASLVTGYQPVLLNRANVDGNQLLAPYNLITTYYWVYDDSNGNKRPVRLFDLEAAFFKNGSYAPEVVSVFDLNADGVLSNDELKIDSSAKEDAVKGRLASLGLNNPRIEGTIQPYSINHNVARGDDAISDCRVCHSDSSRLAQPIKLADYAPNGILPVFASDNNVKDTGRIEKGADGALYYYPLPSQDNMYVFGSNRVAWIDWLGLAVFIGTILGVIGHSALRIIYEKRNPKPAVETKRVYMYEAYERFWHWLQALGITLLALTGLAVHRPDWFGAFPFNVIVTTHTVVAALLVINFLLSLFWHLVSGEIRQYIPHPYGFFDQAIAQAKYYIVGIFKHEKHPFEKTKARKFNPLQKITYFGLMTVLLPLQGLTGILIWGSERWAAFSSAVGGLTIIAPIHSLTAWLLSAFIIGHVYLTTTAGPKPLDPIEAMITGWEDMETHEE